MPLRLAETDKQVVCIPLCPAITMFLVGHGLSRSPATSLSPRRPRRRPRPSPSVAVDFSSASRDISLGVFGVLPIARFWRGSRRVGVRGTIFLGENIMLNSSQAFPFQQKEHYCQTMAPQTPTFPPQRPGCSDQQCCGNTGSSQEVLYLMAL